MSALSTKELMANRETIGKTLDILGGHRAVTKLPEGYEGKCKVVQEQTGKIIGVFPNKKEACSVARYAIFPDGGYGPEVIVMKANKEEITHQTLEDWICD